MSQTVPAPRLSRKARLLGAALLALILYCTLGAAVYFAALLGLQQSKLIELPWIVSAQKALYRGGMVKVNNWLGIPGCIAPDPDLIYVPSIGTCAFDDIEFKTTLTFTEEGRNTGPKPAGTGIAVIGDSHAMGWGANDHETFAAHLQTLSNRPVYNLGVASYGTARELMRLKKSGVLDKVDTVIIQYCNNDRSENLEFDTASRQALADKVFAPRKADAAPPPNKLAYLAKGYGLTLAAPFRALSERLRRKNFDPHYDAFMPVLEKYRDTLANKRVIVFYSNPYGQKYRNFPSGTDARLPNVHFVDLDLSPSVYRTLDNHMNPDGHRLAAERLLESLQP
jgi:hypothetical protein